MHNEIARYYQHVGLAEHVSVASFSRAVLELMEHGAPAGLVEQTLAAAREEVEHAQMALALARTWSNASFEISGISGLGEHRSGGLADFARRTVTEACAGETPAVLRAAVAQRHARDERVLKYLDAVLLEERRHAELAWATVAWSVVLGSQDGDAKVDGAVRGAVYEALASAVASLEVQARALPQEKDDAGSSGLLAVGILSPELNAEVARMASSLVQRLRAELLQLNLKGGGLRQFESLVHHHFGGAIDAVAGAVERDKASAAAAEEKHVV